ncbi:MAG: hypothetical protein U9R79_18445 [Armatimonadota bacterium]|nr:hypothetical protein [Armatimonadota bacterium]
MRATVLVLLLALCTSVAPAAADGLLSWLEEPDAAAVVKPIPSIGHETAEALSWQVAEVAKHRGWFDLCKPLGRVGLGLSVDVLPGQAPCVGTGYYNEAWVGYVGAHVDVTF